MIEISARNGFDWAYQLYDNTGALDSLISKFGPFHQPPTDEKPTLAELQEATCKESAWALCFALYISNADIEYCKAHMDSFDLDRYLKSQMRNSLK